MGGMQSLRVIRPQEGRRLRGHPAGEPARRPRLGHESQQRDEVAGVGLAEAPPPDEPRTLAAQVKI